MSVEHESTEKVHQGIKGGRTGCGVNTKKNPKCWRPSKEKITCRRNGYKN